MSMTKEWLMEQETFEFDSLLARVEQLENDNKRLSEMVEMLVAHVIKIDAAPRGAWS